MKVINRVLLFASFLIFLTGSFLMPLGDAVAKGKGKGPDKSQGPSERPPGWDKGEKKGWDSDVPPGLEGKWKEEGGGQKGESGREGEKKGKLEGSPSTSGVDEEKGKPDKDKEGKEGKKDKEQEGKGKPKKQKG